MLECEEELEVGGSEWFEVCVYGRLKSGPAHALGDAP